PNAGKLRDIKNYLYLFCYFLQPTPSNIRSMLLYAIQQYVPGYQKRIETEAPVSLPAIGVYHPDAPKIFESFDKYREWYESVRNRRMDAERAVGLLLMRPQIVSGTHRHYDGLIRAIEDEGLDVVPAISTFMDNRESCEAFFVENGRARVSQILSLTG